MMKSTVITIGHLYPELLNTYGDLGNVEALSFRLKQDGFSPKTQPITIGTEVTPGMCDIYLIGGGQDAAQSLVAKDLLSKAEALKQEVERGTPILAICGGYQLLGDEYIDQKGHRHPGVGILPMSTAAGTTRLVGRLLIQTDLIPRGRMIGFENHSGRTWLRDQSLAFGRVIHGFGNNGQDRTEGIRFKNVFGTYLHGSVLPNNPQFTDLLIRIIFDNRGEQPMLKAVDDRLEEAAYNEASRRLKNWW